MSLVDCREERGVNRQPLILASTPYSKEEAERIAAELMHAERQAAHAEQQAAHVEQKGAQAGKPAVNASKPTPKPAVTFSEPVPKQSSGPAPKQSKGGGFKSLFKRKSGSLLPELFDGMPADIAIKKL